MKTAMIVVGLMVFAFGLSAGMSHADKRRIARLESQLADAEVRLADAEAKLVAAKRHEDIAIEVMEMSCKDHEERAERWHARWKAEWDASFDRESKLKFVIAKILLHQQGRDDADGKEWFDMAMFVGKIMPRYVTVVR